MKSYNFIDLSIGGRLALMISSLISVFSPIYILALCVVVFILIDFVLGVIVSIRIKKEGFSSTRAWHTVWKLLGAIICILLAYKLDEYVLTFLPVLFLPNIVVGIICGADFWSILTNLSILSNHPVFKMIKKYGKSEIKNKTGFDIDELDNNENV